MSATTIFGVCAAALVGLGLYGLICQRGVLRKIIAFNVMGSGVFLLFGVIARRGGLVVAGAGPTADPVPQAIVITGLVVAFAATVLAVALLLRLAQSTGQTTLDAPAPPPAPTGDR